MPASVVATKPNPAIGALLSGVRIMGCLTILLGVGMALLGLLSIGPIGLFIGAGIGIVGVCMAMVTRVK